MIYTINKPYTSIVPLKEGNTISNKFLLESMHAFDEQYAWAKKTAEIIYNCLLKKKRKAKITFQNNSDKSINGAIVRIQDSNLMKTTANIYGFNKKFYCLINVNTNKDILSKNPDSAISEIWDAIVHELGHANIFLNQYKNTGKFGEYPNDYELWCKVIGSNSISSSDPVYLYCYALYSTFYQEIQAFVSQTYSDTVKNINKLYDGVDNITKQQFWKALMSTNTYQTYKSNIYLADTLIQNKNMISALSSRLKNYGLIYDEQKILKSLNKIKIKSKNALHDAYNNVYYYLFRKIQKPR